MSVRAYKWVTGGLLCATLVLGWRCLIFYRQTTAAAFISFQCEMTESAARQDTNPEVLAHDVTFLIGYYGQYSKALVGSPIHRIVQRDYHHALTNSLVAFRRFATNDLGDDLSAWIHKYGRE